MADDYRPLPRCVECGMLIPADVIVFARSQAYHIECFLAAASYAAVECVCRFPELIPEFRELLLSELDFDDVFVEALFEDAVRLAGRKMLRDLLNSTAGASENDPIAIDDDLQHPY